MTRTEIINFCINKYNFKNYLEIGVAGGENITNVNVEYKDGVDPGMGAYSNLSSLVNYRMESDDFFEHIKDSNRKYDFIFIDGLHHTDQVDKDIENSLNHLSENGIIMLHDTMPNTYESQVVPRIQKVWNGDVWKSVVKLRFLEQNVCIMTLDMDQGCTLLKRGKQQLYDETTLDNALSYEYFKENKSKLMNVVSFEYFKTNI
jgi:hypothetical protein